MTHVETPSFAVRLASGDSITLEGRWDLPPEPARLVVLCHPHPQQRGTMNAPLMNALAESLARRGFAVLRFNFRGVGDSEGEHDFGSGEMDDVAAAVANATDRFPALPTGVAGWSFGAATSLRWQARDGSQLTWVGVALPVNSARSLPLPGADELPPARRTIILGDRDQFATVEDSQSYATSIGAELEVLKGSDHFFYFREERLAGLVAAGLSSPA